MRVYLILIVFLCLATVYAEDNTTAIPDGQEVLNDTVVADSNESMMVEEEVSFEDDAGQDITQDVSEDVQEDVRDDVEEDIPVALEVHQEVTSLALVNITPADVEVGDVLLTIELYNDGDVDLSDLVPVVVGRGFATYDSVPLRVLPAGSRGKMYVSGIFRDPGRTLITVKVGDFIFNGRVDVREKDVVDPAEIAAQQRMMDLALASLDEDYGSLRTRYDALESDLRARKEGYLVDDVDLSDLKRYIMSAEAAILAGDVAKANISIIQAKSEYLDQKELLENAKRRPAFRKVRDSLIIFSGIAGAILTIFAFYEFMKRKKDRIYEKIKEVKISDDTKIIVKKRRPSRKKKKAVIEAEKEDGSASVEDQLDSIDDDGSEQHHRHHSQEDL